MTPIFLALPNLYYALKQLFGIELSFLSVFPMFGLLVMCAYLAAASMLTRELKRKEADGLMPGIKEKIKGEEKPRLIMPHQRVPHFMMIALIGGIIGAKVFDCLEDIDRFVADPIGELFSRGGLTFYGGLIVAAVLILRHAHKKKINIRHLLDSFAPALMLAYAIGRLGCQISGDGDWGIYNTAYRVDSIGHVSMMKPSEWTEVTKKYDWYFTQRYSGANIIQHAYFPRTENSFSQLLPDWFFAQSYPHNVVNDGVPIAGCTEERYCNMLPIGVFPTPLYESIASFLLFFLLWGLRKRMRVPGVLFGIYLFMNGVERFLIEKIRVNTKYHILGFAPTQAELISAALAVGGIVFIWYCIRKNSGNNVKTTL